MKAKACERVGFYSITHSMPDAISQEEIIATIEMMNNNPRIDGILVQLPLPKHVDTDKILEVIDPKKDVDGFHAYNVGRLVTNLDSFVACTPLGVMKMFEEYDITLEGKDVCVVGASNIVGKPMAALLLNANATVTVTHIFTKDLKAHTLQADIVIVGVGVPGLIKKRWLKTVPLSLTSVLTVLKTVHLSVTWTLKMFLKNVHTSHLFPAVSVP